MMRFRGTIVKLLYACGLVATLAYAVDAAAADKIRMGSRLEYYDVVYREGGFDKKYGIEAEGIPFATGVEVVTALQAGGIDIASSGHVPMTILLSKTDKVIAVGTAAYNTGSVYRMVVGKNSPYKTINDLKGKVIATKLGSGSYKAFLSYLKAKGLEEKDFRMKNAGPAAIIAAMQAGNVDAGIWFEPTISVILHKGWGRVLLNFEQHATFQVHWLVNKAFADKNPDVLLRFLAGAMDAQELLNKDPKKASKLITTGYQRRGRDFPAEVFELGIPLMNFDSKIQPKHIEEVKRTYRFLKSKGRIKNPEPNWSKVITGEYLERAQAKRK